MGATNTVICVICAPMPKGNKIQHGERTVRDAEEIIIRIVIIVLPTHATTPKRTGVNILLQLDSSGGQHLSHTHNSLPFNSTRRLPYRNIALLSRYTRMHRHAARIGPRLSSTHRCVYVEGDVLIAEKGCIVLGASVSVMWGGVAKTNLMCLAL